MENLCTAFQGITVQTRWTSRKLKPMIHNKIQNRAKDYPMLAMIPVAQEVMECRRLVMQGVSTLLKMVPVLACK
ncbi:hypothetical protein C1H46_024452 [Malus baccata]|uniref:APO domain-containing protein n=1 Tax=Malus baccata TaxID=106549 RepID=A0A540LUA4_MALBA|nr:hypothetical protein C1H46_024452 [Malus baccata]